MLQSIKFLLKGWIKSSRIRNQDHGFTLVELLITSAIAVLIITPLLGLMVDLMNTDQKEQAKATSEQELQTAIDFISRDLQQAVYIYDYQGVTTNYNSNPLISGIQDSLPTVTNGSPVLVFWKRELEPSVIPNDAGTKDDAFVYSLVAYYLIKDTNTKWSNAARVARWQIKDGVRSINNSTGVTCTGSYDTTIKFVSCPSAGFGAINQKMNQWQADKTKYNDPPDVLIDYIDQTIPPTTPTANSPNITSSCVSDANQSSVTITPLPNTTSTRMTGFYACVSNYLNKGQVVSTAQIFIRGNALARIQKSNINYIDKELQTYFPTISAIVQARGFLYTQ
ncbi:MAG: hormogonium polysaccharide secretion pseudopilin HpsC [Cuspidothrix sp.]